MSYWDAEGNVSPPPETLDGFTRQWAETHFIRFYDGTRVRVADATLADLKRHQGELRAEVARAEQQITETQVELDDAMRRLLIESEPGGSA